MATVRVGKKKTTDDDGESGKKRKKKSTIDVDDVDAVPVSRRTTRDNTIFDTNGSQIGTIPKLLTSHIKAGPGEVQGSRLINPRFCNSSGCKVNTSVPVKCDTSYDSAMNYADRCRNICHRNCAKEAGLISVLFRNLFLSCCFFLSFFFHYFKTLCVFLVASYNIQKQKHNQERQFINVLVQWKKRRKK